MNHSEVVGVKEFKYTNKFTISAFYYFEILRTRNFSEIVSGFQVIVKLFWLNAFNLEQRIYIYMCVYVCVCVNQWTLSKEQRAQKQ
jgi:hypothetical protein